MKSKHLPLKGTSLIVITGLYSPNFTNFIYYLLLYHFLNMHLLRKKHSASNAFNYQYMYF